MSYIWDNEEWKPVTNLGWLLRNWQNVERFDVVPARHTKYVIERNPLTARDLPEKTQWQDLYSAWLIAFGKDGRDYVTPYADYLLLKDMLVRPRFSGLKVRWFGIELTIPDRKRDW